MTYTLIKREDLQQVLDALQAVANNEENPMDTRQAIGTLVAAIAEPCEPVAYRSRLGSGSYTYCVTPEFFDNAEPVYAPKEPT